MSRCRGLSVIGREAAAARPIDSAFLRALFHDGCEIVQRRETMHTVEDLLDRLQRPPIQPAPCWRVRIAFVDGIVLEETFEPDADWPLPLTQHPPARFIARQSMNVLRPYLGKGTRDPVRLEIEPPPGTIDDRGRTVRTLVASVRIRRD